MDLIKLKSFIRILGLLGVALFLIIIGFEALPLLPNSTLDNFKLLGQQRSLSMRMAKDAFILKYRTAEDHVSAIDELQKSLLPWENEQTSLSNAGLPNDVYLLFLQSQQDFASLDKAFRVVNSNPENISSDEIGIIVAHANAYFIEISQSLNEMELYISKMSYIYFLIEITLEIILFSGWVWFMRTVGSAIQKKIQEENTK